MIIDVALTIQAVPASSQRQYRNLDGDQLQDHLRRYRGALAMRGGAPFGGGQ
jgi:hypothetical protein